MTDEPAGWQADPTGRHEHRYWDGSQWTEHVSDAGVAATDAYDAPTSDVADVGDAAPSPDAPDPTVAASWDDPTTAQPLADTTADATAAWPAPPPPPVSPVPTYGPGPAEPEPTGSKKGLLIGGGILAAVAVAVVAFLLLGGDDDDTSDVETRLAAQIKADAGGDLTDDQADCVAAYLVDEIGEERMRDVDLDADDPPPGMEDELIAASFGAISACDIDPTAFAGDDGDAEDEGDAGDEGDAEDEGDEPADGDGTYGSDNDLDALYDACEDGDYQACDDLFLESPSDSEYEDFGDTCGERNDPAGYCVDLYEGGGDGASDLGDVDFDGDMEDTLADIYEQSLGLERSKAECLAGQLAEAISSGDLSEQEAMSDVFSFLEDCDISMEEISN